MRLNHPQATHPTQPATEKLSFTKPVPGAKNIGDLKGPVMVVMSLPPFYRHKNKASESFGHFTKGHIDTHVMQSMQSRSQVQKLYFFFKPHRLVMFYQPDAAKTRDKTRLNWLAPRRPTFLVSFISVCSYQALRAEEHLL